ncbi:MAG: WYL domain-containing protein [Ferruginibacter sp.]
MSRFSLIIQRLKRAPATYEQLKQYLENESDVHGQDFNLSIRTLQRDIKDIYDQLGIEIVNERKGDKRYHIKEQPESEQYTRRLLDAFDTLNIVKSAQQNSEKVFFETRQPKGLEHFTGLLHACSNKKIVTFHHFKYNDDLRTNRVVHPLALKEARGRWYLVAIDIKDNKMKTFGLDRIEDIDISKTSFKNNYSINIAEEFKHAFGVLNLNTLQPQKIKLLLSKEQGQYLINYPLHHSQHIIGEKDSGEIILELYLKISYDFIMELMSFGENIKVLMPKSLVNVLKKKARLMFEKYEV